MLRYCTIMASMDEGAGTQARDSARPAARRPGPRNRAGAVSVLGRPQQRLRAGERVRFCTNCPGFVEKQQHDKHRHGAGRRRTTKASSMGGRWGLFCSFDEMPVPLRA